MESTGWELLTVNRQRKKEYHDFFKDQKTLIKDLIIIPPPSISALTASGYLNGERKKALEEHHGIEK